MKTVPQFDLPVAGEVFNLAAQYGIDGERVQRERVEQNRLRAEADERNRKLQLRLEDCPGFVGADVGQVSRVVIEPGRVFEALPWLKRRFIVSENLDLSMDNGLVVEFVPRQRRKAAGRRVNLFAKPEQFTLDL